MKNYINKDNEIYSYDDNISKELLGAKIKELNLVAISDKELKDLLAPTEEEKKELIKTQKKQQYNEYCNIRIESYPFGDTALIDVTSKNLVLLLEKLTGWKSDSTHINWMEDSEWLQLTKVDLQKICTYAEDLKQAKFEEIFGFGE